VIPDRIEAGTYMVAAAITGGSIQVEGVLPDHLTAVTAKLREMGVTVVEDENTILVNAGGRRLRSVNVKTMPYPGFPTDMQAPFMSLLAVAGGTGTVTETVFESRFGHVAELKRMGGCIQVDGRSATVLGRRALLGAPVTAMDLRGGAALVLAGLAATGVTEVRGVEHIDRGYEAIDVNLRRLGASVRRIRKEAGRAASERGAGGVAGSTV